jgi:two-component system catabolic regulation response regulator CreB
VATGEAALAKLREASPALVILDVGLPDLNGFEVFKRLRAFSELPVVFLTARADEIDRVVGSTRRGRLSPSLLAARAGGAHPHHPAPHGRGPTPGAAPQPFAIDEGRRQIRFYGKALELSRYEYGLLKTLVEHPGHVFSRDTLLDKVWDTHSDSLDRTVDAHVKTLRAKLKTVAPALEPIRTTAAAATRAEDPWPLP